MSHFTDATTVTPTGEAGSFDCVIDSAWFVERGPNGGNVAAILTRAIGATFDSAERPLRSLTVHYIGAPEAGPAQVQVRALREGRSVTFASATLVQNGKELATAQAVLAKDGETLVELHTPVALPDLPPPDLEPHPPASGMPPFARNFEYVFTETPGEGEAVSGGWLRLREPAPLDEAMVVALTDSWIPAIYAVAGRVLAVPTLDLTVHIRAPLPLPAGWAFVRSQSREAARGFVEEDAIVVAPDGTLLAQSRQLALVR